jgi:hypothetical protein
MKFLVWEIKMFWEVPMPHDHNNRAYRHNNCEIGAYYKGSKQNWIKYGRKDSISHANF